MTSPISKSHLKKQVLRILLGHEKTSTDQFKRIDTNQIKEELFKKYRDDRFLSPENEELLRVALYELESDRLVMPNPKIEGTHNRFIVLTEQGKRVAAEALDYIETSHYPNLFSFITHKDLLSVIVDPYENCDFVTAVLRGFILLEEKLRSKLGAASNETANDLVPRAFAPKNAMLKHPAVMSPAEAEGIFFLMTGGFRWYRNPKAHRLIELNDPAKTLRILGFVNLMLDIIEESSLNP